eukprot:TRINITY_DN2112_c0_g3_i1.p1 TRINITY_DN2112_c0_g3~~TRINITY_DN2112_c0_g3_i1.p1  ORF type:complete len:177 (-),score=17.72 TRINITY_DN2112_c0_g3_i1:11-541(-)
MPLWTLILLFMSRRIHSIFMLRLFNDGCAMILLYFAIFLFIKDHWKFGCIFYSCLRKNEYFLFAPALLILLLKRFYIKKTIFHLGICAAVQVAVGWEFLSTYPVSYIRRAFNFGKQFEYKWSLNMQFVSEETFMDVPLALTTMTLHLGILLLFANFIWCRDEGGLYGVLTQKQTCK